MLTYEEFVTKHAAKYAGLSKREKRERYDDYVAQLSGREAPRSAPTPKAARPSRRKSALARIANEQQTEAAARKFLLASKFYQALVDPFAHRTDPPKVPMLEAFETVESNATWTVDLYSNANGEAAIFFRPAIQGAYAVTNSVNSIATGAPSSGDTQAVYDAYANVPAASYAGVVPSVWTTDCFSVKEWKDVPSQSTAMAEQFTDYIITGAGFEFNYASSLLNASGTAYVANLPGAYGAPFMGNEFFSLLPQAGDWQTFPFNNPDIVGGTFTRLIERVGSAGLQNAGPRPTNLQALDHAEVVSIAPHLGFQHTWLPEGLGALTEWRPTRYMPMTNYAALNSIADTYPGPYGAGNPWWLLPPVCPGDPDRFCAFWDRFCSTSPNVSSGANFGENTVGALQETLYGAQVTGTTPSAAANSTRNSNVAYSAQQYAAAFQASIVGDDSSTCVAILTGLPANTKVGTVTFTMNMTALAESRVFRPASYTAAPSAGSRAETMAALRAARVGTTVHPPQHAEQAHSSSIAEKITGGASVIAEIAGAAKGLFNTIKDVGKEVIPIASEIGGLVSAFF